MTIFRSSLKLAAGTALLLGASLPALAAQDPNGNIQTTFPGIPASTIEKLGGEAGISNIIDALFLYIMSDNRINQIFIQHGNVKRQEALNKELVYMVLGGGNVYEGASMSAAHGDLGITLTQFNAVVEDAYLAFEYCRTPYHVANQIIAGLAPFERAIVTK